MGREWCGVIPFYDGQGGNGSKKYSLEGEEVLDSRRVTTVMDGLYDLGLVDMDKVFHLLERYFERRKFLPYVYGRDQIFIPVKMRIPIGKNDGAYGYIRIGEIESLEDQVITLKNGLTFPVLESCSTLEKRIREGKISHYIIEEREYFFQAY